MTSFLFSMIQHALSSTISSIDMNGPVNTKFDVSSTSRNESPRNYHPAKHSSPLLPVLITVEFGVLGLGRTVMVINFGSARLNGMYFPSGIRL